LALWRYSVGVDLADVIYLVKDLWMARSARAQESNMSKVRRCRLNPVFASTE